MAEESSRYLRCDVCLQEVVAVLRSFHIFKLLPFVIALGFLKVFLHHVLYVSCQEFESHGEKFVIKRVAFWPTLIDDGLQVLEVLRLLSQFLRCLSQFLRLLSQFLLVLRDGDLLAADQLDLLGQLVFEFMDSQYLRRPSQFLLVLRDGDLLAADQLDLLGQLVFELMDAELVRSCLGVSQPRRHHDGVSHESFCCDNNLLLWRGYKSLKVSF